MPWINTMMKPWQTGIMRKSPSALVGNFLICIPSIRYASSYVPVFLLSVLFINPPIPPIFRILPSYPIYLPSLHPSCDLDQNRGTYLCMLWTPIGIHSLHPCSIIFLSHPSYSHLVISFIFPSTRLPSLMPHHT